MDVCIRFVVSQSGVYEIYFSNNNKRLIDPEHNLHTELMDVYEFNTWFALRSSRLSILMFLCAAILRCRRTLINLIVWNFN